MIGVGLFVLFLIPGLLAYSAIYGLFHSGKSIAPEPPGVNTIEASVVILLCSAAVHAVTAAAVAGNALFCEFLACPVRVPGAWLDPYARAFHAMGSKGANARILAALLLLATAQGGLAFGLVRTWLNRRARRDRLPAWLYGWAVGLANAADNEDTLVVAYVLTTHEVAGETVVYAGGLFDLGLRSDGSIARLTLWDCERHLVDLGEARGGPTLRAPSSRFPFLAVEASQIRNVAFRTVKLFDRRPPASPADVAALAAPPTSHP